MSHYFGDLEKAACNSWKVAGPHRRDVLWRTVLHKCFYELVLQLSRTMKMNAGKRLAESYEELAAEGATYLFEKLSSFDASKGSNPFGYFNMCAKNWLFYLWNEQKKRGPDISLQTGGPDGDPIDIAGDDEGEPSGYDNEGCRRVCERVFDSLSGIELQVLSLRCGLQSPAPAADTVPDGVVISAATTIVVEDDRLVNIALGGLPQDA